MPKMITQHYHFGGLATVEIYSEAEMADAVGITVPELRAALDWELYGPSVRLEHEIYSFHAHPRASGDWRTGEFQFTRGCYLENCRRANRVRWLMANGHWTEPEACRQFILEASSQYTEEETADRFLRELNHFVAAWRRKDRDYNMRIASHLDFIQRLRLLWRYSTYLDRMNVRVTEDAIIFPDPGEPRGGTAIPWEWLRIHHDYGFYDQRDLPTVRDEFIPATQPTDWLPLEPDTMLYPGDLIAGERWVYDDMREFMGMYLMNDGPLGDPIQFTPNGRHWWDCARDDLRTYVPRSPRRPKVATIPLLPSPTLLP